MEFIKHAGIKALTSIVAENFLEVSKKSRQTEFMYAMYPGVSVESEFETRALKRVVGTMYRNYYCISSLFSLVCGLRLFAGATFLLDL